MKGEKRMTPEEVFAELDWFIAGGVPLALTVEAIGRTPDSLARTARNFGRPDLATPLEALASRTRREDNPGVEAARTRRYRARMKAAA